MGFFGKLFNTRNETIALIDIGTRSVGAGFAVYSAGKPTLICSERVPIEPHQGESLPFAMLRSLQEASGLLVRRGTGMLRQAAGSGSIDHVLVSLASPWAETSIRIDRIDEQKPFVFTRSLMEGVVAKTSAVKDAPSGFEEAVIATILNGYETHKPFGKSVKRADIVVLSTSIDPGVSEGITSVLRAAFHAPKPSFIAFAPLAYTIFRDVYPHEREFLIIDVSGAATDLAFVKQNLLMAVTSAPFGVSHLPHIEKDAIQVPGTATPNQWLTGIVDTLKMFSRGNPLPRTLFLLADDDVREQLRKYLDEPTVRALWLSDEPLTIIPVVPGHFAPFVGSGPQTSPDAFLMMLSLFQGRKVASIGG